MRRRMRTVESCIREPGPARAMTPDSRHDRTGRGMVGRSPLGGRVGRLSTAHQRSQYRSISLVEPAWTVSVALVGQAVTAGPGGIAEDATSIV